MELPKSYNPSEIEVKWYEHWEKNKVFSQNESPNTFDKITECKKIAG